MKIHALIALWIFVLVTIALAEKRKPVNCKPGKDGSPAYKRCWCNEESKYPIPCCTRSNSTQGEGEGEGWCLCCNSRNKKKNEVCPAHGCPDYCLIGRYWSCSKYGDVQTLSKD